MSEAPILNNDLIRRTGYGKIFRYGDAMDLVFQYLALTENPPIQKKTAVMAHMIREHGWNRRVEAYMQLFQGGYETSPAKGGAAL